MKHGMPGRREGGAILIVTLLFLVILTMLGVTAMTGTTMEERMAGNTRDSAVALQAAEAALRDARRDISRIPVTGSVTRTRPPVFSDFGDAGAAGTCSATLPGLCMPALNTDSTVYNPNPGSILPSTPAHSMTGPPSVAFGDITNADDIGGGLARQPRYLLELFCLQEKGSSIGASLSDTCVFYRITARGYGRNPNTFVTLQEVFVSLN